MESREAELLQFKQLDLVQYALSRGFRVDRKASSQKSVAVRHINGDKLIIGQSSDGTYFYFNAKGNDNGTIVDLVQYLDGGSIGDVRKTLRQYVPSSVANVASWQTTSQPKTAFSRADVVAKWRDAKPLKEVRSYLSTCRSIPISVYLDPVFAGRFRIDSRGNVLAVHCDEEGVCGFEMKNGTAHRTTFTGFSPGGVKGLCVSRARPTDSTMVVAETFIDMLSVAALEGTRGIRFFSTSGRPSPKQVDLLKRASRRMPSGASVQLRFDNDAGGEEIAEMLEAAFGEEFLVVRCFPAARGADWNDVLRNHTASNVPGSQPS